MPHCYNFGMRLALMLFSLPLFAQTYDLVIATNILVYYDAFDRALALLNIASMMMAAGEFQANSPLPACPALPLHATGSVYVRYSSAAGDDDRIEIYSNSPLTRPLAPQ